MAMLLSVCVCVCVDGGRNVRIISRTNNIIRPPPRFILELRDKLHARVRVRSIKTEGFYFSKRPTLIRPRPFHSARPPLADDNREKKEHLPEN